MSLILSVEELREITGYARPARIITELLRLGFYRARVSPTTGRVLLERAHYDAVCSGHAADSEAPARPHPKLRSAT